MAADFDAVAVCGESSGLDRIGMIKFLLLLIVFINGSPELVHAEFETIGECRDTREYYKDLLGENASVDRVIAMCWKMEM